ncbi:MAG: DUF4012 domain-containing protein [Patescibacteria group bacterium]|nr:DUF4012 domain-containing protein [Patescibacteria group bacterium]MDD5554180.1 DUF4012 domain-containing protein [Patescibacteria group bacterium]
MPRDEKQNILSVKKEDRSSRFVVDLKKAAEEEESGNKEKKEIYSSDFFTKLEEFDFKEFFEKGRSLKKDFSDFFNSCRQDKANIATGAGKLLAVSKMPPETKESLIAGSKLAFEWLDIYSPKLKQLAFFSLIKFILAILFKIIESFYKFCYRLGWLVLFLIRFFGLVLYELAGLACLAVYKFCLGLKFISQFLYVNFRDFVKDIFEAIRKFILLSSKNLKIGWNGSLENPIRNVPLFGGYKPQTVKELYFRFYQRLFSNGVKAGIMAESIRREKAVISQRLENNYKEKKAEMPIGPVRELPSSNGVKAKFTWRRSVLGFALVLLILVLPFKIFAYYKSLDLDKLKGKILGASEAALGDLSTASQSAAQLNFGEASDNFSKAGENFLEAQKQVAEINDVFFSLASLAPGGGIKLAGESKKILDAGQVTSSLGGNLSLAMQSLFENKGTDIPEMINSFIKYGKITADEAADLNNKLKEIDINALPDEYKDKFLFLQEKTEILEKGLAEFVGLMDKLGTFLGTNQDKRYLLVFQNNAEMRASGGFIGSFALVDMAGGKIKNIEAPGGGSYDTEGGLKELVTAPGPLHLVNPLWHFWDANWWPDWPTSAKELMWFYEKSDGPTVDGVISFTPTVLEKLLAITGPIDMTADYGVTLTAENFWLTTQTIVEAKPTAGEANQPKKIIGDLLDKIIGDLPSDLNKDKLIKLLALAQESLEEKHILFYFTDEELQKEIEARGWDGKIRETGKDYLSVINTNIAGGKSDKRIKEKINLVTEIMPNGSVINTLKIERSHEGIKNEPFAGVRNVDWLRVYVPLGSELLEAQGFSQPDPIYFEEPEDGWAKDPLVYQEETTAKTDEASGTKIYGESGKTVFANWSMVDPGKTATIYLKYKLPFILKEEERGDGFIDKIKALLNPGQKQLMPYTLFAQKQAGSLGSEINTSLKLPDNFKIVWKYPASLPLMPNGLSAQAGWYVSDKLDIDKYWAVMLENQN